MPRRAARRRHRAVGAVGERHLRHVLVKVGIVVALAGLDQPLQRNIAPKRLHQQAVDENLEAAFAVDLAGERSISCVVN